jgi:hypothetical protein
VARATAEVVVAGIAVALVVAAIAANQSWLDRHFLPSFFIPRHWYVLIETAVRAGMGAVGILLALGRTRLVRLVAHAPAVALQVVAAATLALFASELALRWIPFRPAGWLVSEEEPRRQRDAQLGWVLIPGRSSRNIVGGRTIDYAIDAAGYRVRQVGEPVDIERPTAVFVGESVMFGEGLTWAESIPARVGAMLGVQSANLAVHGYSNDQAYGRLVRELPRFHRPTAVVAIFMSELFGRNLDDDRPHLGPGFVWQPAERPSRLASLAVLLVPYRRTSTVEQGVRLTRDVLHGVVQLARLRGATPLIVVPQLAPEDDAERELRERIVVHDIPSVIVRLDPGWRLPWNLHPNAKAAEVIAAAVAARLRHP